MRTREAGILKAAQIFGVLRLEKNDTAGGMVRHVSEECALKHF